MCFSQAFLGSHPFSLWEMASKALEGVLINSKANYLCVCLCVFQKPIFQSKTEKKHGKNQKIWNNTVHQRQCIFTP